LHLKFDIQGLHKIVNLGAKDQAMWLADVWIQLVSNFKATQRQYKKNVNEHKK
jgi:hypothetical protein